MAFDNFRLFAGGFKENGEHQTQNDTPLNPLKKKVKVFPPHAMKAYRGVEVQLHTFLTWALSGGESSTSSPATFTPGK